MLTIRDLAEAVSAVYGDPIEETLAVVVEYARDLDVPGSLEPATVLTAEQVVHIAVAYWHGEMATLLTV